MVILTRRRATLLLAAAVLLLLLQPVVLPYLTGGATVHAQGIFDPALKKIEEIARDAWVFLTGLLIVVAVLGGLYYTLQGTAGAAFGGSRMVSMAVVGGIGLVILVLIAFLVLPELADVLGNLQPAPPF